MDNGASSYLRFLDGDDEAFVEIIRDYKDGLIFFLDSIVHNLSDAEDLMEDTFVKIVIKKPSYFSTSSFKTWLYSIGRNVARDWLRKKRQNRTVSIDDVPPDFAGEYDLEQRFLDSETKSAIHKALRRIHSEYAQVLYLVYFENFSNAEIAKVMRKNRRQVENLVYRAKKSLKMELDKEGFVYEGL